MVANHSVTVLLMKVQTEITRDGKKLKRLQNGLTERNETRQRKAGQNIKWIRVPQNLLCSIMYDFLSSIKQVHNGVISVKYEKIKRPLCISSTVSNLELVILSVLCVPKWKYFYFIQVCNLKFLFISL